MHLKKEYVYRAIWAVLLCVMLAAPAAAQGETGGDAAEPPAVSEQDLSKIPPYDIIKTMPMGVYAIIDTSMGRIVCMLFPGLAPIGVGSFVRLAEGTQMWLEPGTEQQMVRRFYDGLTFHRVIPGYIIQGGDPKADGTGGPGYSFPNEVKEEVKFDRAGLMAYANKGPDTNGSQFFITLAPAEQLNGQYTIFGQVMLGMEVAEKIAGVETDENDKPKEDVVINRVWILWNADNESVKQILPPGTYALLETSMGRIVCMLFPDIAPKTVENFIGLAEGTKEWTDPETHEKVKRPLYDGTIFHRVIPNFMIQGGDPTGTGRGGPGYKFEDEFHETAKFDFPGKLAMANSGPNTNGSQFFITHAATTHLNNKHTIFGQVVAGQSVVEMIGSVPRDPKDKPLKDVTLDKVTILRVEEGEKPAEPAEPPAPSESPEDAQKRKDTVLEPMEEVQKRLKSGTYAVIDTTEGRIVIQLFPDAAPKTVENFVGLAEGTKEWTDPKSGEKVTRPFYDGLIFHRVIPGFMIQGGDPLGNGTGDPGYKFEDEFDSGLKFDKAGILAMANSGPNTNGSQFFITHGPTPHLNNRHTIFGQVEEGQDIVDAIGNVPAGPGNRPDTDVVMEKVTILRVE